MCFSAALSPAAGSYSMPEEAALTLSGRTYGVKRKEREREREGDFKEKRERKPRKSRKGRREGSGGGRRFVSFCPDQNLEKSPKVSMELQVLKESLPCENRELSEKAA